MREETFHLYGIKITCTGDIEKARTLTPHARRLMPQIKALGVPMHTLRDPDGSYVQLLHQAGMDFARIHVPVTEAYQQETKEDFILQYFPAWFAYNSDGEHVGYILAKGGGWQPPYEFIPREAEEMRDTWDGPLDGKVPSFEMGQWVERAELWGDSGSRPFEWDDFLLPKLVTVVNTPEKEKMYWDIAPIGAKNRIFECAMSEVDANDIDEADAWLDHKYEYSLGDLDIYVWIISGTETRSGSLFKSLTLGAVGEESGNADEICEQWEGGAIKPLETVFTWSEHGYSDSTSGTITHAMANECFGSGYEDTVEAYEEVAESAVQSEKSPHIMSTSDWGEFTCTHEFHSTNVEYYYNSAFSSAKDGDNYGACFIKTTTSADLSISQERTDEELLNAAFEYSKADALYIMNPQPIGIADTWSFYTRGSTWDGPLGGGVHYSTPPTYTKNVNEKLQVNVSGQSLEIPLADGVYNEEKSFRLQPAPRYYQLGETEYFLISLANSTGDDSRVQQYVFIRKSGGECVVDYSVSLSGTHTAYKLPLPDVTGPDGCTLYIGTSFRLIREDTKTMEQ